MGTGHYKAIELLPELEKNGIVTNLDLSKYNLVKDKLAFKKYLVELGYRTPNFIELYNNEELFANKEVIRFPCVLKSAIDVVQPIKVDCFTRLEKGCNSIFSKGSAALIEEYVDGSDCTVAVANDNGVIEDFGVIYYSKAKEYKLEGFNNARADKLDEKLEFKITKLSRQLVSDVDIPGLVRVDFVVKDELLYILEINAVMVTGYNGSAYPFFASQNIDIASIMARVSLNICKSKVNGL
ncbi:hypothetical protein AYI97_06160 [Shewanella algae]|nr:hypothetical protein AYI97_06160 [Shewanella algae]